MKTMKNNRGLNLIGAEFAAKSRVPPKPKYYIYHAFATIYYISNSSSFSIL